MNTTLKKLSLAGYLLIALVLVFGTQNLQAQQVNAGHQSTDVLSSAALDDEVVEPVIEVLTPVASRTVSAVVRNIRTDVYTVGIMRADGTPIGQTTRLLQDGVPMVIDIEKVETGIYILYAVIDGRTISASFLVID